MTTDYGQRGPGQIPAQARDLPTPGYGAGPQGLMPPEGGEDSQNWQWSPPGQAQPPSRAEEAYAALTGSEAAGTQVIQQGLGMHARSLKVFNTSNHLFMVGTQQAWIPPRCFEYWIRLDRAIQRLVVSVYTPGAGVGDLKIVAMETDQIQPTGLIAASTATSGPVQSVATAGALHHAASVITIAAGVGSLAARATRNGGVLRARKANTADIVVETTGFHLQAGDALSITAVDLYSFTGTNGDLLDVYEEFN